MSTYAVIYEHAGDGGWSARAADLPVRYRVCGGGAGGLDASEGLPRAGDDRLPGHTDHALAVGLESA
jgi:hypothetical protein